MKNGHKYQKLKMLIKFKSQFNSMEVNIICNPSNKNAYSKLK